MDDFTFVSAFSGIGGFDLGLERAGFTCAMQIEIEKSAISILERHSPNVPRLKDIRDANYLNVPRCRVLVGGFPCQDVSTAGRRQGLAGSRSGLWFEFHRLIREVRPEWVIIENVPGLLSSHQGRDFAAVLAGLTGVLPHVPDAGWRSAGAIRGTRDHYHACWRVLDSQYFGVPQRRRRVFIVANLTTLGGSCAEVLFESESGAGHPQSGKETWQSPATTADAGASGGSRIELPHHKPSEVTDSCSEIRNHRILGEEKEMGMSASSGERQIAGTLGAAAGINRGLGQANETDLLVNMFQFQRSDRYSEGDVATPLAARDEKFARDLVVEAIDVRNLRSNGDQSGTLQSKAKNGYSLNFTNPIAFSAGQSAEAGSVAASEKVSPTLKGASSGTNQVPAVAFNYKAGFAERQQPIRQDGNAGTLGTLGTEAVSGISPEVSAGEEIMPALTQPSSSGGGHPVSITAHAGVRRLTPIECARLQAFPDDWCEGLSDSAQYRLYGNAVTVSVIEWIGHRLMRVIKKQNEYQIETQYRVLKEENHD